MGVGILVYWLVGVVVCEGGVGIIVSIDLCYYYVDFVVVIEKFCDKDVINVVNFVVLDCEICVVCEGS